VALPQTGISSKRAVAKSMTPNARKAAAMGPKSNSSPTLMCIECSNGCLREPVGSYQPGAGRLRVDPQGAIVSSLVVASIVFICVFGSGILSLFLRSFLSDHP